MSKTLCFLASTVLILVGGFLLPVSVGEDRVPGITSKSFPESWAGKWKGRLVITSAAGKVQQVPATLEVGALPGEGRWRWAVRYGDQPVRDYALLVENAEEGRYVIDEGNSTLLPARLIGGELMSVFGVAGNRLTVSYRKRGDAILLHIVVVPEASTGSTGGEGRVPSVSHYEVKAVHEALLRKDS